MTKPFCHLLLHYSVARLSWKTIKSLRRARSRLRVQKKCDGESRTPPTDHRGGNDDDDVSPVEYEILQGWTILAFHSMYVSTGFESVVRFFVPFYFHLKVMGLIATFVVPSWAAGRNGGGGTDMGEFGLSPVISYWFDYVIVPAVNWAHEFVDHDPKGWAKRQVAMLPLLLIDMFIIPGLLLTDEERQRVRISRRLDVICTEEDAPKAPPSEAFPPQIINDNTGNGFCDNTNQARISEEKAIEREQHSGGQLQFTLGESNCLGKVSGIDRSPARTHLREMKERKLSGATDGIVQTPPRDHKKSSNIFNHSTQKRVTTSPFPRTTPTRKPTPSSNKKSFNSIISPVAKSRLASSALRLKRFSRDHRNPGGPLSPITFQNTGKRDETSSDLVSGDIRRAEVTKTRIMGSPSKNGHESEDNQTFSRPRRAGRKRRERLSLGDHFRELVTGDANIRVRDHLFDLDLPPSPRRKPFKLRDENSLKEPLLRSNIASSRGSSKPRAGKKDVGEQGDANVTTRRSSRLANQVGRNKPNWG